MLTQINAVKQRNEELKARAERAENTHASHLDENKKQSNLYGVSNTQDNIVVGTMDVAGN